MAGKRLILVEGTTDRDVLMALAGNLREEDFQVARTFSLLCGSIESVMRQDLRSMAIVFDANGQPTKQWRKVREEILAAYALVSKEIPAKQKIKMENKIPKTLTGKHAVGVWVENYKPWIKRHKSKLGMWMMPNNYAEGELEHFLSGMISGDDYCWELAKKYVAAVARKHGQCSEREIFPQQKTEKAKFYAWLAVQKSPGAPFGPSIKEAVKDGYLDINAPEAERFQKWLAKLQAAST